MNRRNIIINSAALFVIAFVVQTILHELGHYIAAIVLHGKEVVLYHNRVQCESGELSTTARILIAAAGPILSLCVGFLFHRICASFKKRNLLFFFFLYMAAFGYINFFGYLMVAPFFIAGDTGFIFHELQFPLWLIMIIALAGIAILFFILKKLCHFFIELAPSGIIEDLSMRRSFANSLVMYPLFIGIVITTLLSLPAPVFLSVLYPMFSPFALMWCYGYLLRGKFSTVNASTQFVKLNKISPAVIFTLVVVVLINRLLVFGF